MCPGGFISILHSIREELKFEYGEKKIYAYNSTFIF